MVVAVCEPAKMEMSSSGKSELRLNLLCVHTLGALVGFNAARDGEYLPISTKKNQLIEV